MFTDSVPSRRDYQSLKQVDAHLIQHGTLDSDSQQQDENSSVQLFSASQQLDAAQKTNETSTWKIFSNIINYLEGAGFLAFPYAVKEGGITAVIAFIVFPFIMAYTVSLLAECIDEEDEYGRRIRKRSTYQDVGKDCWAPFKPIIWVVLFIDLLTTAMSFIVLCGSLMSQQFPQVPFTESQWTCIVTLLVLPTVFLKQFSQIAWISLIGFISLVASAVVALRYEFQEIPQWNLHSLLFWDTRGVFVALPIISFSYGIHTLCVSIAADVSDQSKFRKALVLAYVTSAVFKTSFAVSGFLTYTTGTNEVILNNLPAGIPMKIVGSFFAVSVLLTFPLPVLVIVRNIEELLCFQKLAEMLPPKTCFVFLRIIVPLIILGLSVCIPHFALVSALSGCFTILLSFMFPGLFHLRLKYKQLSKLRIVVDVILIITGFIAACFGLVTTIMSIFMEKVL